MGRREKGHLPCEARNGGLDPRLRPSALRRLGTPAGLPHLDVRILEPRSRGTRVRDRARQGSAAGRRRRRPHLRAPLASERRDPRGPARCRSSDGARAAAVFNSGMAAIATLLLRASCPRARRCFTRSRSTVVRSTSCTRCSSRSASCDGRAGRRSRGAGRRRGKDDELRLIFVETPANPTLRMSDIAHAVEVARRHPDRPRVAVDNTFLGPMFQHPLELGADLVVYSATKFLGGFSDMLAGVVMSADAALVAELRGLRALFGNILQADESWILDSRLSTVATAHERGRARTRRRSPSASRTIRRVKRVFYPSLFTDPEQTRIRDAQCDFPGIAARARDRGRQAGRVRVPASAEDRAQRGEPRRRRDARVPSDDDHAQRALGGRSSRRPASPKAWCASRSAPSIGGICSRTSRGRSRVKFPRFRATFAAGSSPVGPRAVLARSCTPWPQTRSRSGPEVKVQVLDSAISAACESPHRGGSSRRSASRSRRCGRRTRRTPRAARDASGKARPWRALGEPLPGATRASAYRTIPGAIVMQRMPSEARSRAIGSVIADHAALRGGVRGLADLAVERRRRGGVDDHAALPVLVRARPRTCGRRRGE